MDIQQDHADQQHKTSTAPRAVPVGRSGFQAGNPYRWQPGQTGNPGGKRKGASFAAALARQAVAPVTDRDEMVKIAQTIGIDPADAKNIDVVAALFYTVLCRLMVRATSSSGRVDERLVGMLQVLLRALDPAELRVSGPDGGPIPIAAVVADVQAALGMRPIDDTATVLIDEGGIVAGGFDALPQSDADTAG